MNSSTTEGLYPNGSSTRPPVILCPLDIIDGILHRSHMLDIRIGNRHPELLFQRHDDLDDIEAIGAKIIEEAGLGIYSVPITSQTLDNEVHDTLCNIIHTQ